MHLPGAKKRYWPTLRVASIAFLTFFLYAAVWLAPFPALLSIHWTRVLMTSLASGLGAAAVATSVCLVHNRPVRRRKLHDSLGIRVD